jgi:hypothetical protein
LPKTVLAKQGRAMEWNRDEDGVVIAGPLVETRVAAAPEAGALSIS